MSQTAVPNSPAITLLPTGPGSATALNPVYTQCDPANGNYFTATNRDLVTFYLYPASSAPAFILGTTYPSGSVVNFAGDTATVTSVAETSGDILTILAVNTFTVGQQVIVGTLTTATFLNGQTLTVTSASGTQFTAIDPTAHGVYGPTSDSGSVGSAAGTFIALVSTSLKPHTPAAWATYSGASDVTLYSAPDACTGRKSDVDDYNVPLGAGSVEFLVLPSSVFTQANGQVQFLASSNLVYVYIRNL